MQSKFTQLFPLIKNITYINCVKEGEPDLREDGKWYQTWNVRKFNLSEKKRIFVTKDILMKRFHLCNTCEKYNKKIKICRECLCFMPFKRKFVSTGCPLEKW